MKNRPFLDNADACCASFTSDKREASKKVVGTIGMPTTFFKVDINYVVSNIYSFNLDPLERMLLVYLVKKYLTDSHLTNILGGHDHNFF